MLRHSLGGEVIFFFTALNCSLLELKALFVLLTKIIACLHSRGTREAVYIKKFSMGLFNNMDSRREVTTKPSHGGFGNFFPLVPMQKKKKKKKKKKTPIQKAKFQSSKKKVKRDKKNYLREKHFLINCGPCWV